MVEIYCSSSLAKSTLVCSDLFHIRFPFITYMCSSHRFFWSLLTALLSTLSTSSLLTYTCLLCLQWSFDVSRSSLCLLKEKTVHMKVFWGSQNGSIIMAFLRKPSWVHKLSMFIKPVPQFNVSFSVALTFFPSLSLSLSPPSISFFLFSGAILSRLSLPGKHRLRLLKATVKSHLTGNECPLDACMLS